MAKAPEPQTTEEGAEKPVAKKSRKWLWLSVSAVLGLVAITGGLYVYVLIASAPTPAQLFEQALEKHRAGFPQEARELCLKVQQAKYRDPNFPGGVEFLLGMADFRDADQRHEGERMKRYESAIRYFKEAELQSVNQEFHPEWAYALGVSLHRTGRFNEARLSLEQAVAEYPPGRVLATSYLVATYLHGNDAADLKEALRINQAILDMKDVPPLERDKALLQRSQILAAQGNSNEAEAILKGLSSATDRESTLNVLRAQSLILEKRYQEAQQLLEQTAKDPNLEESYARQARYLLGVSAERLGDEALKLQDPKAADRHYNTALTAYKEVVHTYEREHEALAAMLNVASLLRRKGRTEEAFEAYTEVIRMTPDPDNFRNRWLDLEELRRQLVAAWDDWVEQKLYSDAIKLAEMMPPLIARDQALEYIAQANQRWAEHLTNQYRLMTFPERQRQRQTLWKQWAESGKAFAQLARARVTAPSYPLALWTSAEHFAEGHRYKEAIEQYKMFLAVDGSKQTAMALVHQGLAHLNLQEPQPAEDLFQRVSREFPTDPIVFEARYHLGQCQRELQDYENAERTWIALIESPELTPNAREWQRALSALTQLKYDRAEEMRSRSRGPPDLAVAPEALQLRQKAYQSFDECIQLAEQFLERYPQSEDAPRIRYLLAQAWQLSAEWLQLQTELAETDSARGDYQDKRTRRLENSLNEFQLLQLELRNLEAQRNITNSQQIYLRNTYFQIPHNLFLLDRDEECIEAYSAAASRYQAHPAAVLACLQMALSYDRTGKTKETTSMLDLAKRTLSKVSDNVFASGASLWTRAEWESWLNEALTHVQKRGTP